MVTQMNKKKPKKTDKGIELDLPQGGQFVNESMMPYKFEAYEPKPKEPYMSDRQLAHFRNILETWKKELMKEVDNTITEMKGASVLADPNDRATQEETFNLELRTRDRERKLIRKIEEALQQIDDKEYGYCESCGVEIGIRRLEARPTAVLCIDCKTLDEIRERTSSA
jgi:RNA polymerase-binding transcription factor